MAIRGHAEKNGNLYHLLLHMAKYDSDLQLWIDDCRYISHDVINKLIALMGQRLLRQILHNIQQVSPPWYGLMADEATDAANKELLNITIRWVVDNYEINEDPIGHLIAFLPLVLTSFALEVKMCFYTVNYSSLSL